MSAFPGHDTCGLRSLWSLARWRSFARVDAKVRS